ncbi:ATP-binding cassette domain-containing protein [Microterricola viridarii]|uniref:ABC transporter ATP-binding protein n=1 Tax=Microterricola viridarii TaxID=412690 RepID=A0A120I0S5_9MICO|nr:ABC transporter ATP-binding protein [Microterricola viridarii]AMB58172.1 ABC transporter ATP-binding protein [Microterricola viridarii]
MSLLRIDNLSVSSASAAPDAAPLVDELSFSLERGARLGLIGESGSGKSLTSLAITGLLPTGLEASGSVILNDTEVIGADDRVLRPLRGPVASIVFQEPLTALDPLMRVGRQVAGPIRRHRGLRGAALDTAVREALDEVALPDLDRMLRAYPHEISGGQRQRVAIAIALASRPALLIADEPTTALDVTVQAEVLQLLNRLVDERAMALLFISHDLAVVSSMVDEVIVLSKGVAVERGPVTGVLRAPQHEYTARLVASAAALDGALDAPRPSSPGPDTTRPDSEAGQGAA